MKKENVAANSVRHDKNGISLISLIITIIVIIILAAIVIFSGLNTPDSAQFAGFTQQVDNVYQAVLNKYGDLKAKHAIAGEYRTDEQIYIEIATATDHGQYASMNTLTVTDSDQEHGIQEGTGIQNIQIGAATNKERSIGMTLPKVRQSNTAWYVTKEGKVFNANGYIYDGKTYFSGSLYQGNELPANETSNSNRAYYIYEAIKKDINLVEGAPAEGTGDVITGGSETGREVATPTITNVTHPGEEPVTGDEVTIVSNGHTDNYYYVTQNGSKKVYLAKTPLSGTTSWATYNSAGGPWHVNGRATYHLPYDLNDDVKNYGDVGDYHYNETNPYSRAKAYGTERLVIGRLLTKDEYDTLKTSSNWASIYPNDGSSWWLGSAVTPKQILYVLFYNGDVDLGTVDGYSTVRPVIEF